MPKVLLAITSFDGPFYQDGAKTGLFASEAIHPFEVFRAKGYDVQFVSETGSFAYDEHSLSEDFLSGDAKAVYLNDKSEYNQTIKHIKKASDVNAADYSIFFAAGGHGTCFDFPKAEGLVKLAEDVYAQGGVVAAVCHGPIIFSSLKDPSTGKPLIEGKKVTGFTNDAEKIMGLDSLIAEKGIPTPEGVASKAGATFSYPAGPWDDYTVTDGRIVTGVNPASATSTAQAAILASNA